MDLTIILEIIQRMEMHKEPKRKIIVIKKQTKNKNHKLQIAYYLSVICTICIFYVSGGMG